ncbi:hypothetical protein ACFLW7_02140 [Chloroflexota bacterium]
MKKLAKGSSWWTISSFTDYEIYTLSYYLDSLHSQLETKAQALATSLYSQIKSIKNGKEAAESIQRQELECRYHIEVFPRLFLNSFHIAAYSLLETEVFEIARRIGKKQRQPFDVSEIKGSSYLESAIYYIEKLTGINAKRFDCWNGLAEGQRVRNVIVHSRGKPTKESDIQLARRHGVYDERGKRVTITYEYCRVFIGFLKSFFGEMYKQIEAGGFLDH